MKTSSKRIKGSGDSDGVKINRMYIMIIFLVVVVSVAIFDVVYQIIANAIEDAADAAFLASL